MIRKLLTLGTVALCLAPEFCMPAHADAPSAADKKTHSKCHECGTQKKWLPAPRLWS